ncbi:MULTISPECIES: phage tail protein [unclassified Nocardioides]|uniref:phage tail protein n=1 Tax=unclassified Nocardioides TaxID=2615069 RepID=UPI001151DC71|nr:MULTISPECIES: tail fiber protein [unclassified Nocardioides]TQK71845.1 microcystin-dependent protein [Nocardioides sp. SLBN-35]WGY03959.1 tail fiber protein [Nocardioides sp. QY071]
MAQPYVGEIRMFAGSFAPAGWAFCNGAVLPISENDVLFQLIGTTYGGDGQETFALPNLQSRIPIHMGTSTATGTTYQIGETGGVETVTLSTQQIPNHTHALTAVGGQPGNQVSPAGNLPAMSLNVVPFINDVPNGSFAAGAIDPVGGSQPHENMQPFLCVSFIISLFGIFPNPT